MSKSEENTTSQSLGPFPQAPGLPRRVSAQNYYHSQAQAPKASRARSASTAAKLPTVQVTVPPGRNHSSSISSVESATLSTIIEQDSNPYNYHFKDFTNFGQNANQKQGRIKLDNIDIEKQLIITAGGKREYVLSFILKLLFLMVIVLGSGVLIFYAL